MTKILLDTFIEACRASGEINIVESMPISGENATMLKLENARDGSIEVYKISMEYVGEAANWSTEGAFEVTHDKYF